MSATTYFDCRFHRSFFALTYYSIFFSEQWFFINISIFNGFLIIVTYLMISLLSLPGWGRPNFLIALSIGSNLCYHNLPFFSQHNGALSQLMWFNVAVVVFNIDTLWMSVTPCFDRRFHQKCFAVTLFSAIFPAPWQASSKFILLITNSQNRK